MTSLIVKPGRLPSEILLPSSKSYANRALILASLSPSIVTLSNLSTASDVTFLINSLQQVGVELEIDQSNITIKNSFPSCERKEGAILEIGEGGTTGRFLACLLCLGSSPYTLILGKGLKKRPWEEFILLVKSLGAMASLNDDRLTIQGPINIPKKIEIDCSKTTQFASGFQLAFAFKETEVKPVNLSSSQSYWEMTKSLIAHFKVTNHYFIPLDWSSASYPLAFGALNQDIFLPQLSADPYQADYKFYELLKNIGAVERVSEGIKVHPVSFKGSIHFDVSDCLDLVPALVYLLAHIEGSHELTGVKNLVFKESNRLSEVLLMLKTFNIEASSDGSILWIRGKELNHLASFELNLPEDHRLVMMAALFFRHHSGGTLSPAEAVEKSYPDFFKLFV